MTQKETLDDLRARSKAVRDSSRRTMDEANGHEQALSETLDRSADNNDRAEAQMASWPKAPPEP